MNNTEKTVDIYSKPEEFHKERAKGIGGSDSAIILGVSDRDTQYELWMEKTGRKPPKDLSHINRVVIGNLVEEFIGRLFTKATGIEIITLEDPVVHPVYPCIRGNVDFLLPNKGFLECKNIGYSQFKDEWGGGEYAPLKFYTQAQHYFGAGQFEYGYFSVLVERDHHFYLKVEPDWDYINNVHIPEIVKWWDSYVVKDVPPPMEVDDLQQYVMPVTDSFVEATPQIIQTLLDYIKKGEECKKVEEEKDALGDKIRLFMQDKELLTEGATVLATYKTQVSNRFQTPKFKKLFPEMYNTYCEPVTSRVLRPNRKELK